MKVAMLIVSILLMVVGIFIASVMTIFMIKEYDIKEDGIEVGMGSLFTLCSLGLVFIGIMLINNYVI